MKRIEFKLNEKLYRDFKQYCLFEDVTMSRILRKMLEERLYELIKI